MSERYCSSVSFSSDIELEKIDGNRSCTTYERRLPTTNRARAQNISTNFVLRIMLSHSTTLSRTMISLLLFSLPPTTLASETPQTQVHCNPAQPHIAFHPLDFAGHTRSFDVSEEACRHRCYQIDGCHYFQWDSLDQSCRVADSQANRVTVSVEASVLGGECTRIDDDNVNEAVHCSADATWAGVRFYPADFLGHTASVEGSMEGCRNRCHVTQGCRFWSFDEEEGRCRLSAAGAVKQQAAEGTWGGECVRRPGGGEEGRFDEL